jgi:hypothetical protein
MITSTNYQYNTQVLNILNYNRISDNKRKEAIKAMGMSTCQAVCMSRGCNSKCHGGGHR